MDFLKQYPVYKESGSCPSVSTTADDIPYLGLTLG